jgi:fumarate reductase subunit C
VSAHSAAAPSPTRTLPPRAPDGFPLQQRRYFWYVLFAGTGLVLSTAAAVVLYALSALAGGFASWERALGLLSSPVLVLFNLALLVGVLYFALRFLWVGIKIPSVPLGPIPAPPPELILVAHFAGFATLSLALLLVFSGVVR